VDTKELTARLERHYIRTGDPLPGGVFLREINAPGDAVTKALGTRTRRCDALYMGFTATKGRLLEGHEIKVSRADWLHELNDAHKADWWFEHTHRWWVVVADEKIVAPGELPPGWGLIVPGPRANSRLRVAVQADTREALIDFGLLHEIVKKMDVRRREEYDAGKRNLDQKVREGVAVSIKRMSARDRETAEHILESDRVTIEKFEKASGLSLSNWRAGDIGDAVKKVLADIDVRKNIANSLRRAGSDVKRVAGDIDKALERLEEHKEDVIRSAQPTDGVTPDMDPVVAKFERLSEEWRRDTQFSSSVQLITMHPSYQQIIGMGAAVLPLILADLQSGPDHWFWALSAICGEDVAVGTTDITTAANEWLAWGKAQGII
jgi:hypothetical protein